ncbi:MAG: HAD family phosphatase [Clostridiaceae bacterium]|nr:HAD family phosphatase [Clostridiaceae bacterium]
MTYKLIAVDIDGTLLNDKGQLTEGNKEAIRKAVDKGVVFTIATGRAVQGVINLIEALNIDIPFITYNGAMVIMGKSREILYERKLNEEDARIIINLGKENGSSVMVWNNNNLYVTAMDERVDKYKNISKVKPILIENMDEVINGGVSKVLWYNDVEKINEYQKEIDQYISNNVNFHTSQPYFLEFNDKLASKAIAMENLGKHFGIQQSEMIAVGDGYNDLSMIDYAGLGVAMANAPDEIKQRADYVTLSNNDDGVAHVIREFIL